MKFTSNNNNTYNNKVIIIAICFEAVLELLKDLEYLKIQIERITPHPQDASPFLETSSQARSCLMENLSDTLSGSLEWP